MLLPGKSHRNRRHDVGSRTRSPASSPICRISRCSVGRGSPTSSFARHSASGRINLNRDNLLSGLAVLDVSRRGMGAPARRGSGCGSSRIATRPVESRPLLVRSSRGCFHPGKRRHRQFVLAKRRRNNVMSGCRA
jgi:hypothetical protein